MKEISITWATPVKPEVITTNKDGRYDKPGLYIFYGYHRSHSGDRNRDRNKVLLYIGKACNLKRRIKEHKQCDFLSKSIPKFFQHEKITISIGFISDPSFACLDCIKGLLTFVHCPPWNSENIRHSKGCYKDLIIHNDRYNKELLIEEINGREITSTTIAPQIKLWRGKPPAKRCG